MDTETKPLWSITREAMGKTWTIGIWPTDKALGQTADGHFESALSGHTSVGAQTFYILATDMPDRRDETLLHELIETAFVETNTPYEEAVVSRISFVLFAFLRGFGLWRDFPWGDREEGSS